MLAPAISQPSQGRLRRLSPKPVAGRALTQWPAVLGWLCRGTTERFVLFLPLLLLPAVGGVRDLLLLTTLFLLVTVIEVGLQSAPARPHDKSGLAVGALAWLVAGLVLGTATALVLALFVLVRSLEQRLPRDLWPRNLWPGDLWPIQLGLAALAAALLVDLALIALALERSSVWLALAAAIGTASAAACRLDKLAVEPPSPMAGESATVPRVYLETALAVAGCLVLALYAMLLAHEPVLSQPTGSGRFLALPFLAAAVVRVGWLGLESAGRRRTADPLALLLLASWALASVVLKSPPAVV